MTAAAAVDGIREVDSTGSIGLISAELDAPYDRPPLSKALWKGQSLDIIWRKTENKGVTVHLGSVVKEIVPKQKRVVDDEGDVFTYQKLLLALCFLGTNIVFPTGLHSLDIASPSGHGGIDTDETRI